MQSESKCPLCGLNRTDKLSGHGDFEIFECNNCGKFKVTGTAKSYIDAISNQFNLSENWRARLSHRMRIANDKGIARPEDIPVITGNDLKTASEAEPPQEAPKVLMERIIRTIGDQFCQGEVSQELNWLFWFRIGASSFDQLRTLCRVLREGDFLSGGDTVLSLSHKGFEWYADLTREGEEGTQAFIAMAFGEQDLEKLVEEKLKPTIRKELGIDTIDMRDAARAGVIDNVMREEIRRSKFVLVDLTHDNSGAYWEAGYAEGIGKPVIFLCESDKFKKEKTHFDTAHCTTVRWGGEHDENFEKELIATIRRSLAQ